LTRFGIWWLADRWLFDFLSKFSSFLELFPHVFFDRPIAYKIKFEHGLLNGNGFFGSHAKSGELEVPE
jgi:hypothetical protein